MRNLSLLLLAILVLTIALGFGPTTWQVREFAQILSVGFAALLIISTALGIAGLFFSN